MGTVENKPHDLAPEGSNKIDELLKPSELQGILSVGEDISVISPQQVLPA